MLSDLTRHCDTNIPDPVTISSLDQNFPPSPQQASSLLVLGIQGGKGSFNEEAARYYCRENKLFPDQVRLEYLYTSPQVMAAVEAAQVERGQCAIYNSAGGWVEETTDALKQYAVDIVEEFEIRIAHAIMLRPDQQFSQIKTLMCHPQVFAQCTETLARKYPQLQQISGTGELIDNARIAEALSKGEVPDTVAVMGSKSLADIYNLVVVEDNLQDLQDNLTRFLHVVRKGR
jgi:prephenate dehydratase